MSFLDLFLKWADSAAGIAKEQESMVIFLAPLAVGLIIFGAASRRLLYFLAVVLLTTIGFSVAISPGSVAYALVIGCALGSLLIGFAGFRRRRYDRIDRENIVELNEKVERLRQVAERQFLRSLNSPSGEGAGERPPTDRSST